MVVLGKAGAAGVVEKRLILFYNYKTYILSYLADLFLQGGQFRMIGVHRSGSSSFHIPLEGVVVGQHPFVDQV